jgi:uncharacterized membrane protein YgcG
VVSAPRRLFPWALTALLLIMLCATVCALYSLVISPLRRQVTSVELTAQALRDGAPVVVTQAVVNEAGDAQIIYVTVIATQLPLVDRLNFDRTPTPTPGSGWYVSPTATPMPLQQLPPPPPPDPSGGSDGGGTTGGASGGGTSGGSATTGGSTTSGGSTTGGGPPGDVGPPGGGPPGDGGPPGGSGTGNGNGNGNR